MKKLMVAALVAMSLEGFGVTILEFAGSSGDYLATGYKGETVDKTVYETYYSCYFLTKDEANTFAGQTASATTLSEQLESLFSTLGYNDGVVAGLDAASSIAVGTVQFSVNADPVKVDLGARDMSMQTSYKDGFAVMLYNNGSEQAYTIGIEPQGEPYQQTYSFFFDDSKKTEWKAFGAVPEPTSAMLMLLGIAGLALKRRRA